MKNLKQIFIVCLLAGISLGANAQLRYGVKAGFNASTIMGIADGDDDAKVNYKPGFNIGVAAQYMFAPQMGVETGLYYSTLGTKIKWEYSEDGYTSKDESSFNPSYLQLPVSFLYKINAGEGLSICPSAGIYFGYGMGGKMKNEWTETYEGETESGKSETDFFGKGDKDEDGDYTGLDANRFDMGLTLGLSLEISKFSVGLGYDYGFMKLNKEERKNDGKKLDDWKNGNIKVSVGYFF